MLSKHWARPLAALLASGLLSACAGAFSSALPAPKPLRKAAAPVVRTAPVAEPMATPTSAVTRYSETVEALPIEAPAALAETQHGPDVGSRESVSALFFRGYIESALREAMLAAILQDYPYLTANEVKLTDAAEKFLTSSEARLLASRSIRAGFERAIGRKISMRQWEKIWQALPQRAPLSFWAKELKRLISYFKEQ
ncbi:MAG: hypothetical protein ACRCYV_08935 [Aeromonas sp.]